MITVNSIMDQLFSWFYYGAMTMLTDLQTYLGKMGLEIFDNTYAAGLIQFFNIFAWSMFGVGSLIAISECAIDAQSGGGNIKETGLNILTGFLAAEFFSTVPVNLYAFSVNVQSVLAKGYNLAGYQADQQAQQAHHASGIGGLIQDAIGMFNSILSANPLASWITASDGKNAVHVPTAINLIFMLAFVIAVGKIIFDNLKRGAILLAQICVCSLYMFSIPRGYKDGFFGWCKQVVGLCFTVFLQNMFLVIGLSIFKTQLIVGLGVIMGAAEIPRIAQQFGLDTSTKSHVSSMAMTVNSFMNVGKTIAKACI